LFDEEAFLPKKSRVVVLKIPKGWKPVDTEQ